MKQAIYPGSFDPVTVGHIDIIERACKIYEKIIICIMVNPEKNPIFSLDNKIDMLKLATAHLKNVEIDYHEGLLVDYCKKKDVYHIIKGMRSGIDLEAEHQMATINQTLLSDVETLFLLCKNEHRFVSSTAVRQLIGLNGDFSFLVHSDVHNYIKNLLGGK